MLQLQHLLSAVYEERLWEGYPPAPLGGHRFPAHRDSMMVFKSPSPKMFDKSVCLAHKSEIGSGRGIPSHWGF